MDKRNTRGRPRATVVWPEGEFTFKRLDSLNTACQSLLRRRVRQGVKDGDLIRVSTMRVAKTGRPESVYKQVPVIQHSPPSENPIAEPVLATHEWATRQQELAGTNTPSS